MKNTNPIFSVKNFRSFGEEGADFELAPITVLTGCNSAGKSSLVKALMLLSGKERTEYMTHQYSEKIAISSKALGLGGYKTVANKNNMIELSYVTWSPDIQKNLVVTRKFGAKHNDALKDGSLHHLTVSKTDGTLIFEAGPGRIDGQLSRNTNCDVIREEFNRFYAVGCYMRSLQLFPVIERRKNSNTQDDDIYEVISEKVSNSGKERLQAAGVTESDAVSLWKEFNHSTFRAVVKAGAELGAGDNLKDSIQVLLKEPEEDELELMLNTFLDHIVSDACSPYFTRETIYVNSTSAQIARLYSIEDDNKMCNALRKLNDRFIDYYDNSDSVFSNEDARVYSPGSFLNRWIKNFEIGDGIKVQGTDEGLGLMTYLKNGNDERLLADEGYGITQLVSLLLQIDNSVPLYIGLDDDDYIPLQLPGCLLCTYPPRTICVEEPEIHLHPKYQAMLAEMFVEAYQKYNIHFIIETHSEYLIRKLQVMVAEKKTELSPDDVSLNYVEKDENGVSHNRQIKIQEDGRLDGSFGKGFYDEAGGLSRQLFMLTD